MESQALVLVQYSDQRDLAGALLQINLTRRQRFYYQSVILTDVVDGWLALLLGEGAGLNDHLLMRNLSGTLQTVAFELRLGHFDVAYRLHSDGRTISSFESNLPYHVNQRLRLLERAKDASILDLGEPLERFVLKRYHELQHPDEVSTLSLRIPDVIHAHYSGDATALKAFLKPGYDTGFITGLLAPGFGHEQAFEGLTEALAIPFLDTCSVTVEQDGAPLKVEGSAAMRPATWHRVLPNGWMRMPAIPDVPQRTSSS